MLDKYSMMKLVHVREDLGNVIVRASETFPLMVVQGSRSKAQQELAVATGHSKAHWGQSPHDFDPALGADCAPLPLDWKDEASFRRMGAALKEAALKLGISVVWGGDWTMAKEGIVDLPHIQLANWKQIALHHS